MPQIEVSIETDALLTRAAAARGCSPSDLIAALLATPEASLRDEPLVGHTLSAEFRAKHTDADRYLALLAWVATHHPADFSDFIEHQDSGRRYLGLSPEEIRETCRHNQAREVPGTRYWAITNLDTPTKRRFLRRLLVFVGTSDEVIAHVLSTIGPRSA